MRWRDLIRGERGEIAPHASRGSRDSERAYGFDPGEYPGLAEAADAWAEGLQKLAVKAALEAASSLMLQRLPVRRRGLLVRRLRPRLIASLSQASVRDS